MELHQLQPTVILHCSDYGSSSKECSESIQSSQFLQRWLLLPGARLPALSRSFIELLKCLTLQHSPLIVRIWELKYYWELWHYFPSSRLPRNLVPWNALVGQNTRMLLFEEVQSEDGTYSLHSLLLLNLLWALSLWIHQHLQCKLTLNQVNFNYKHDIAGFVVSIFVLVGLVFFLTKLMFVTAYPVYELTDKNSRVHLIYREVY